MNAYARLQQTAAWVDIVELRLCLFLYDVCNDRQFESMPGSDFVNFLNLKPTQQPVAVCPRENLRICYMVYSVAQTIKPHERGKRWAEEFLSVCGISQTYYEKHRTDICSAVATDENKRFRKAIDMAIEKARRLTLLP
ncbi:hypothetical protein [uncultured Bacteroides sp.]|uniref:hypothetical protein n=1 Tax=uncultured Bacteroides sp. TaxID=162156 RepID=UPI00263343CE|nr:hypothetical protein [uncultured Bacteroides sp.]